MKIVDISICKRCEWKHESVARSKVDFSIVETVLECNLSLISLMQLDEAKGHSFRPEKDNFYLPIGCPYRLEHLLNEQENLR